ncbi:MAG: hypothetical protein KBG75_10185, partial [Pseudomonadales bacterium]|nr:hypothetical protein [Pseudomonadales bacterium]
RGLSGTQGVVIPRSNVQHLMLKPELVQACREGRFHVYGAASVDEALELMTGLEAGTLQADGTFSAGSMNECVRARLGELVDIVKKHHAAATEAKP